jgi:hypothetical protein
MNPHSIHPTHGGSLVILLICIVGLIVLAV